MKKPILFSIALIMLMFSNNYALSQKITYEQIKKNLPKMLGANNIGREFWFSFIPCYEENGPNNGLKIYISSGMRTKVTVEVLGKGYEKIKYTIPNDIIEFELSPAIGTPYRRRYSDLPEPDQVWKGAGIHIKADDPIICYGVTRYKFTTAGFLALPVTALGKEYIVASYADMDWGANTWFPSYTSITAAYDKTKVIFTMGGNDWSVTASGQKPGEVTTWNLDQGDVLLFASVGPYTDLSGSRIEATKPVGVVSGNFCTYIPSNCGCCDIIEEMELPTHSWGTEYHVTRIIKKKKNSFIKIFAKEPNTDIYRDHQKIGFIRNAGGVEGVGYIAMRADEGTPRPIVISGDKPISVTQFNTGQQDDNVPLDPFQLVLTPIEQYQKEIVFNTPGIRGDLESTNNYINLVYEATRFGTIPEDLEFASVVNGEFKWQKMIDLDPNPGFPFHKEDSGKNYYLKTLLLPDEGVYKLRSSKPFAAYIYSSPSLYSYGFPASVAVRDLSINDTLPPEPEWVMDDKGNVNAIENNYVTDKPDTSENRSNLSIIYMHTDKSYNYKFEISNYMPCEDQKASWKLETIDPNKDAFAVVTFTDCSGNDTTLFIEYEAPRIKLIDSIYNFGLLSVGDTAWKKFAIINQSTKNDWIMSDILLKYKDIHGEPQGFTIWDETKKKDFVGGIVIPALDTLYFYVRFVATENGKFWDSIGIGDTSFFEFRTYLEATVGKPLIKVSDMEFPLTEIGNFSYKTFDIKNDGNVSLIVNSFKGPFLKNSKNSDIFSCKNLDISPEKYLYLEPGERSQEFIVFFTPEDSINYIDTIYFMSSTGFEGENGVKCDSICVMRGKGVRTIDVLDKQNKRISFYPNPAKDYIILENIQDKVDEIAIINELGEKVWSKQLNSTFEKINLKNLPNGNYIITFFKNNVLIYSEKVTILK